MLRVLFALPLLAGCAAQPAPAPAAASATAPPPVASCSLDAPCVASSGAPAKPTPTPMPTPSPSPWPQQFKGWELYSFKVDGTWRYALLVGTNRNKTWAEIQGAGNATGEPASYLGTTPLDVKGWFERMPAGETVTWSTSMPEPNTTMGKPPDADVARIQGWAKERGINLGGPF